MERVSHQSVQSPDPLYSILRIAEKMLKKRD